MILNVDFALKFSHCTSLKRFICFKWILKYSPQYYILSLTTIHGRSLPLNLYLSNNGYRRFLSWKETILLKLMLKGYRCACNSSIKISSSIPFKETKLKTPFRKKTRISWFKKISQTVHLSFLLYSGFFSKVANSSSFLYLFLKELETQFQVSVWANMNPVLFFLKIDYCQFRFLNNRYFV